MRFVVGMFVLALAGVCSAPLHAQSTASTGATQAAATGDGAQAQATTGAAQPAAAPAAEQKAADTGTDPTRVSRMAQVKFEYISLGDGFHSSTLKFIYTTPLGRPGLSGVFKLPLSQVDVLGNNGMGLGDASVQVGQVFGLTRQGGNVVQGELFFDSASRPELGNGQAVFKGSYVRAFFQKHGILAPSFVHNVGLWGKDSQRADVNLSTFDLYYVPKMKDPRTLVTFDPNYNYNWESDLGFASLAVTVGRVIGPAFGGQQIVLVKPSFFVGGRRPSDWGIEFTYRVIGF